LPAALEAIRQADVILLGPGSLYTSVIPNLLVDGISDAIRNSRAMKIYICNIMTQDGETEGMSASDHVSALLKHGGNGLIDICLCNSEPVSRRLLERYSREDAEPMNVDTATVEKQGVQVIMRPLLDQQVEYARHSGTKVAEAVIELYRNNAKTRIF
jgi:uncharacterized cofD-like protein